MNEILNLIISAAIKYGPGVIDELHEVFQAKPTLATLQELRHKIETETYAEFVPDSDLPVSTAAVPILPAVAGAAIPVVAGVQEPGATAAAGTDAIPPALPPFDVSLHDWVVAGGEASAYPPAGFSAKPA